MTVTNGTESETVTVPAVMGQKYETVITPTKGVHASERTKEPTLNGHLNGVSQPPNEITVNGGLSLPAIPTVDGKTEVATPPGQLNGHTDDLKSLQAFGNGHVDEDLLPSTKLQRLLKETDEIIVCPGVYDGFSARIALSVGFKAMYMLHDMREHAEMIANLDPNGTPLIADMDTGYGGPIMVTNAVNQYIRAGVAGFHIEDQVQHKRCGHLQGKKVVEPEVYLSRIRAAKAAKDKAHSDIVLIARTDANQQYGYDECISRLKAARDIGADVGLLEGFTSKEQARQAVQDLAPWPLLLNSVENGHSPLITVDEAKDMGFRIMIFSFAALAPAYTAIKSTFETLKYKGVTGTQKELTPKVLFDVCGLQDSMTIDANAGGLAFAGGV
ncbi:MAG: hypothetical protein Q9191_007719 [Dirinaria sp. TL-2023a]